MKIHLLIISFFAIFILSSCSTKHLNKSSLKKNQITLLQNSIQNMANTVSKKEAYTLAKIAVLYSLELKKNYKLVSPALYHNTLINIGIKERGFCYDFTQDLIKELKKQDFKTLELRWAVHKRGKYFEHNAVLITAKNKTFNSGIILDAWRNSGILFWSYLKEDKKYSWSENIKKSKFYGNIK